MHYKFISIRRNQNVHKNDYERMGEDLLSKDKEYFLANQVKNRR